MFFEKNQQKVLPINDPILETFKNFGCCCKVKVILFSFFHGALKAAGGNALEHQLFPWETLNSAIVSTDFAFLTFCLFKGRMF